MVSTNPSQFEEAVRWFITKTVVNRATWDTLTEAAQKRAFTVSGVQNAHVLQTVFDSLERAIAEGRSLKQFKRDVEQVLRKEWGGSVKNPGFRIETIYRTNVQSALNAGRLHQLRQPDVVKSRPIWVFDALMDGRTSSICIRLSGIARPNTDPWWKTHIPPMHFNCRSKIKGKRRGKVKLTPPSELPEYDSQEGFGLDPLAPEHDWEPDLTGLEERLAKKVKQRLNLPWVGRKNDLPLGKKR